MNIAEAPKPKITNANPDAATIARLRHTQLELALEGRIEESAEIAERAQRMLDHFAASR